MGNYDPAKAIKANKSIKKEQLIAKLGFLNYISFADFKKRYQGTKIEDLSEAIISKFNRLLPDLCGLCSKLYEPEAQDIGANCFICDKTLCPECCPQDQNTEGFLKILFPICLKCVEEKHKPSIGATLQIGSVYNPGPSTTNTNNPGSSTTNTNTNATNVAGQNGQNIIPQDTTVQNSKVCQYYLNKCCKYYNTEQQYKNSHPKLCNQLIRWGRCKDTNICQQFYHPDLCKFNKRGEQCFRQRCKFYHIKNKKSLCDNSNNKSVNHHNFGQSQSQNYTKFNNQNLNHNPILASNSNQNQNLNHSSILTSNSNYNHNQRVSPSGNQGFQKTKNQSPSDLLELIQNLSLKVDSLVQWY